MSSQIMKRSYTIIAVRGTGVAMEIDTMASYQDALTCAKEANENKNNVEVRIIENKYDEATKKDKKTLVKLLNSSNSAPTFNSYSQAGNPAINPKQQRLSEIDLIIGKKIASSITNLSIAGITLIIVGGLIYNLLKAI